MIVSDGDGLVAVEAAHHASRPRASCRRSRALGDEIGAMLAISLHAVRDDLRDKLVPLNKKYPIKELLEACRDLSRRSPTRAASPSNT